jgi:hypothetical protein
MCPYSASSLLCKPIHDFSLAGEAQYPWITVLYLSNHIPCKIMPAGAFSSYGMHKLKAPRCIMGEFPALLVEPVQGRGICIADFFLPADILHTPTPCAAVAMPHIFPKIS